MQDGTALLAALRARGLLYQHSDGLAAHLSRGPISAYCGFDPTASSLHVGNLVPAMGLLRLADAGHRVIALVGGGTAMVGDPSGKSTERPLLSDKDVEANAQAIAAQLSRVLGTRVEHMNNALWLGPLGAIEFLRDVGKHFPVNQMLAKDSVKSRLDAGISYTEFSYMLFQAYDYLQLFQRHNVTLQIGGSDQWGNLTAGMELIRRSAGGEAHALTYPLVTSASGKKFGKTEGGAVWLDPARTSPYAFYQFWINTEDADVGRYLRTFTILADSEIEAIETQHASAPQERLAQRTLAHDVTSRVHSAADANRARAASEIVFNKKVDAREIADDLYTMLATDVPHVRRAATELGVAEVLESAFGVSRSAARKLVQQGGVTVNGAKLSAETTALSAEDSVRGKWFLVRKGARDIAIVEVVNA
ncbi:MAG TPA: tyrosine--tRNA ligase [Gemmatimonadaceae bacterium]|nr:tyrosine--tRNA ligase [Gemmatimonadaceae bacterium]